MKIADKISFSFLMTATALTLIIASIFYVIVRNDFLNAVDTQLDSIVYSRAQHIETYLNMLKMSIGQLSKSVVLENLLKSDPKDRKEAFDIAMKRLSRTKEVMPSIAEFLLLDSTGHVIASSDLNVIGDDMSADAYFAGGQKTVYIKDAYYSKTLKEGVMGVSGPIIDDRTGELLGVVVAKVGMEELCRIVTDDTGFGRTEEVFILNKYGYMITPSRFMKDTFLKARVDTVNSRSCIANRAIGGACKLAHHILIAPDYRGVEIAGSNAYIPEMQWSVISKIDADEVLAPLAAIRFIIVMIVILAPFLAWLCGIFFARIILKPVAELRRAAEIVGAGNLDYNVNITTKDEVGALSRAFNKMTGDLKHTTASLGRLNKEIDQRKVVEEKLAVTAREWETTFNSIPDLISIYDKDFKIIKVNKSYLDFFKVTPENIIGKFCYEVVHGTHEPFQGCPHKKTLETKQPQTMEAFEPRLGIYIEASTAPIFDDKNDVVGTVHIVKDITARRITEQDIRRLAAIVESSDDAIIGKDRSGMIVSWNKGAARLYGYTEKEALGKSISILIPADRADEFRMTMQKIKNGEALEHFETIRKKKDGARIRVSLTISPMKDSSGAIMGVSTIAHDITERKKLEGLLQKYSEELEKKVEERTHELKESQEKLVRSEKLAIVGRLASSVAHELRNPLGVIKNVVYYLNMMEKLKEDPEVRENLDIVTQEIENSDKIITDLLEFSRAKAPVFRPDNINRILKEVLDRIKIAPDIELALKPGSNLPDIEIDALQIHQIFYNLIKNALEAMEKGGKLTISTRLQKPETREQSEFVEVAFSDTGSGVSKENISKIFEPLFSTKTKGTGLGLSVCASLLERHDGSIGVESVVGKGSTFTVKLPVRREKIT